jgi:hypothetical protein
LGCSLSVLEIGADTEDPSESRSNGADEPKASEEPYPAVVEVKQAPSPPSAPTESEPPPELAARSEPTAAQGKSLVTHTGIAAPLPSVLPVEPLTKEFAAPGASLLPYSRVTHTKAPALPAGAAKASSGTGETSITTHNIESTDCAPGVTALGLCTSK